MSEGERRSSQREALTLKVEYDDAAELVADYTENISQGGTFIQTTRELSEGTTVRLILSFPGLLKPLPLTGVVKWTRTYPPEQRGVGVAFDVTNAETTARLATMIQRIAAGDPEIVARNLRVLVVEDNPHVASLIRDGLTGGGARQLPWKANFQFGHAANGREALDALRASRFDFVIVDIYLPVMDGAQLIEHMRADEHLRSLPVVAVSAGGAAARDAALGAGADFFLDKPMRLADIVDTIRRLAG
ncbi:MAG TPA: TIGR02266 family protein, partial [Haliangiales bacterium]|nr:TIGR02266 family protein [Haliangiales bacterium]